MNTATLKFVTRGEDTQLEFPLDLPEAFKQGRKDKVEKIDKPRRKTTKEDLQLELDLYPLRLGETMQYSIDSSIRLAGPQ